MEPSAKRRKEKASSKTIFDLNDECFTEIFSYFSIRELMELDKVCLRFQYIAEEYFFKQQKVLSMYPREKDLTEFAERLGPFVSTVTYEHSYRRQPTWIYYCINIEHLIILNSNNRIIPLESLKAFKSLKSAQFIDCYYTDEINDWLRTSSKLESLSLCRTSAIEGSFLTDLKQQLKEIDLRGCNQIFNRPSFGDFCRDNHNLEVLALSVYSDAPDNIMTHLDELKNLKRLIITIGLYDPPPCVIPDLPKLTHLDITSYSCKGSIRNFNGFLDHVADMDTLEYLCFTGTLRYELDRILPKFTKLKLLEIRSNDVRDSHLLNLSTECKRSLEQFGISESNEISAEVLLQFLRDCPNVKTLNLAEGLHKIFDDLLIDLVPILNERPHFVKIGIYEDPSTQSIREKLKLHRNQKIKINEVSRLDGFGNNIFVNLEY